MFGRGDGEVVMVGEIRGSGLDGGRGKELEEEVGCVKGNGGCDFDNKS